MKLRDDNSEKEHTQQTLNDMDVVITHIKDFTQDDENKTKALAMAKELNDFIGKLNFNLWTTEYVDGYGPGKKEGPGPYNG